MGAEDDFPGRRDLGHGRGGERNAHAHLPIKPGAEPSLLGHGRDGACGRPKVPAFSVLLIVAALVLTGVLCLPLIKVQYLPQVPGREISVSFSWPGASALVVEQKVTSRLEAALGVLPGCEEVSSVSGDGYGLVNLRFGKMDDMAALRFEMASIIRNLQEDLPQGVSYPELSLSVSGKQESASLVYVLQSDYPARSIAAYAQEHILPEMARLEGVRQLGLSGWNPEEWVVCFEPGKLASAGISVAELEQAVRDYFRQDLVGMTSIFQRNAPQGIDSQEKSSPERRQRFSVRLNASDGAAWNRIPVAKKGGRIYYLSDVAEVRKQEKQAEEYFRINGLNTLTLSVFVDASGNLLEVADRVKEEMERVAQSLPSGISSVLIYDASAYVAQELDKIYFRTLLCVVFLLAFVYAVSRSWRYLLVIALSLIANLFVSVILYKVFDIGIHIYSLAGITVSLSIIIDTAIVMADHYSYHHDRKVAFPIFGAIATTLGALISIWVLPERQRLDLADFAAVIGINLSVSFFVALYFVPALLDKYPLPVSVWKRSLRQRRRLVRFNHAYAGFIRWGSRHRWLFLLVLIWGFGIPFFLLPEQIEDDSSKAAEAYNRVMESPWVGRNQVWLEKLTGGSSYLFYNSVRYASLFRNPDRPSLSILARMPENCTLEQMDEVLRQVERMLATYPQIESFQTRFQSVDDARIQVFFKPEFERTDFPSRLKQDVVAFVHGMGAAGWMVDGVDNKPYVNIASRVAYANSIKLTGYDYTRLLSYAEVLLDSLAKEKKVASAGIADGMRLPKDEYHVRYDKERLAAAGLSELDYYRLLDEQLYQQECGPVLVEGAWTPMRIESAERERFDLWHALHAPVGSGGIWSKFSASGTIEKRASGIPVRRSNQSYELNVGFDYMGSPEACSRFSKQLISMMNREVLPMGFKAEKPSGLEEEGSGQRIGILFLVVLVIYWVCAVLFDSLRKPLVIVLLIPCSFIGVFLLFGLTDFAFDQGGFAAMVLLSGIVVNAGIYLVCEEKAWANRSWKRGAALYLKAFHHKIVPILLTILSTVLGLLPFLYDGPDEVFWFSFAMAVIGGIVFSLLALFVYLPVFLVPAKRVGNAGVGGAVGDKKHWG